MHLQEWAAASEPYGADFRASKTNQKAIEYTKHPTPLTQLRMRAPNQTALHLSFLH